MAHSLTWRGAAFAGGLSAIAGFVDAVAYLHLGGYFVSFMSGNTTRASAALVHGSVKGAALAFGLILFFVLGVMASTALIHGSGAVRRHRVLTTATLVLLAAAAAPLVHAQFATPPLLAAAMGITNTSYTEKGKVSIGLTYMTGTLVKIGQHLVAALRGDPHTGWLKYLALWAAISIGGICGALTYRTIGLNSLWVATGALGAWTFVSHRHHS
ncbi:MAG TPA: YoaK family protein [Marmoricola sp.]|nr:YoaK family protein [Marmoricola sp.]